MRTKSYLSARERSSKEEKEGKREIERDSKTEKEVQLGVWENCVGRVRFVSHAGDDLHNYGFEV